MSQEHDDKIAYLQMVESAINRMSSISATFKGFAITVFAGVPAIVFSVGTSNRILVLVLSCIALLAIGGFDCWYLSMEKRYRNLYSGIVDGSHPVDFDMRCNKDIKTSWVQAIKSKAVSLFYLIFVCTDLFLILSCSQGWV